MPINIECRTKCREVYQECLAKIRRREADPAGRTRCEEELNRCLDACREQPPPPPPNGGCKSDDDCPEGFKCNQETGKCYKPETPPPEEELVCYNNKCIKKSALPPGSEGKYSITACKGKSPGDDCSVGVPCQSDADCPEGQRCENGKCTGTVTKLYCCKRCENGAVKKIESAKPCVAPYVPCDEKLECNGNGDGENPCSEGGYRAQTVDGKMISPCKEGHFPKKNDAGEWWCCVETAPPPPEGCEGGHKMPHGTSNCEEGYKLKVIDGVNWCCPEAGNGEDKCAGGYKKPEGEPCPVDFDTKAFEGVAWCCPKGEFEGEEFEWSKELQELLAMLRDRFKGILGYESPDVMGRLGPVLDPMMKRMQYLYDYPRGLRPEERQDVINYAMKGMQRGERGQLQSMRDRLARMGLGGSKFELREAGRIGRETREGEADIRSQLAIDELDKRFKEIMGTTGMAAQLGQVPIELEKWDAERMFNELLGTTGAAQGLMGTFMGAETMPETLSAARRQEGYGILDMLIRYLATMMGGQQSFLGPYMQAIAGQRTRSGSEGISNWLPYLMMMFQ